MLSLITECLTHLARRPRKVMARRAARKASLMAADEPEQLSWRASYAVGATPSPEVPRSRRKAHGVWMDLDDD